MKIIVVEPFSSGGMIHYAYQVCEALVQAGAEVVLVTGEDYELMSFPHRFEVVTRFTLWPAYDPASSNLPHSVFGRVVRHLQRAVRRCLRGVRLYWQWWRITQWLLAQQADVIQFGHINYPFVARHLKYLKHHHTATITQICHEYESREVTDTVSARRRRSFQDVYDCFDIIFVHGHFNRTRFMTLFNRSSDSIHAIAHGNEMIFHHAAITADLIQKMRTRYDFVHDDSIILFFGVLQPSKGIDDLIRAFSHISCEHDHLRLLIAGFPSKHVDVQRLKQLACTSGCADRVIFDARYIPVEEVGLLMELASIVVFPYRNATQSGALQVACSFGKPVIVTRVGALPEAVTDRIDGLVIDPSDREQLVEAMLWLINHPDEAKQLGQRARKRAEAEHNWQHVAQYILSVYSQFSRHSKPSGGTS